MNAYKMIAHVTGCGVCGIWAVTAFRQAPDWAAACVLMAAVGSAAYTWFWTVETY